MSNQNLPDNSSTVRKYLELGASKALLVGKEFDLSGCYYGQSHTNEETYTTPFGYYYFLAGIVNLYDVRTMLEIGTHYGGACKSMLRGVSPNIPLETVTFVTVDITNMNEEGFKDYPDSLIHRVQGDAGHPLTFKKIIDLFDQKPIDLLYIDAVHTYEATANQLNIYAQTLRPRLIVLDDIHLNDSMEHLWQQCLEIYGERALDVTEQAKRTNSGFGMILLR